MQGGVTSCVRWLEHLEPKNCVFRDVRVDVEDAGAPLNVSRGDVLDLLERGGRAESTEVDLEGNLLRKEGSLLAFGYRGALNLGEQQRGGALSLGRARRRGRIRGASGREPDGEA